MNDRSAARPGELNLRIELSRRNDFGIGSATVRPSLRRVEGPDDEVTAEPRVMQVLIALADAHGQVLSRDDLIQSCWEGRLVGEDAINRAVAEVRRIVAQTGSGLKVETVPRVGYRLIGGDVRMPVQGQPKIAPSADRRQALIGGGALLVAAAAGGAAFVHFRSEKQAVQSLIEQGRDMQASGDEAATDRAKALFERALRVDPRRAEAWGWLALVSADEKSAREAAFQALRLDPQEPNARAVLAVQRRDLDDWTRYEDALLGILRDYPENAEALSQLTLFYQGMGRCGDSLRCNERAIRIEPFRPSHHARRALKHWIYGRVDLADQVADRALQLWPRNPIVWNARLNIYAFTDRPAAARALLEDRSTRPLNLSQPSADGWAAGLRAIDTRSPGDLARAIKVNMPAAKQTPGAAANAIMMFSYLGALDAAYTVADGLLTGRGSIIQQVRVPSRGDLYSGPVWGRTQFLFIPATAPFRNDERFAEICRRMGHIAYWKRRRIWPDTFVRGSLDPAALGKSA